MALHWDRYEHCAYRATGSRLTPVVLSLCGSPALASGARPRRRFVHFSPGLPESRVIADNPRAFRRARHRALPYKPLLMSCGCAQQTAPSEMPPIVRPHSPPTSCTSPLDPLTVLPRVLTVVCSVSTTPLSPPT